MSLLCRSSIGGLLRGLLFLTILFFLNFVARILFSPLLPLISREFNLEHAAAGSLFFLISSGYAFSILMSGQVSSRLNHKRTIVLSVLGSGLMLLVLSQACSFFWLQIGLFFLGAAAGLYLPSGLASVARLVGPSHLAKGMAIHELAPNLAFIAAPLLIEWVLRVGSWRQGLLGMGLLLIVTAVGYWLGGTGNTEYGTSLTLKRIGTIAAAPGFWVMVLLFSLAICSSFGIYAMLPLFLVADRGMNTEEASHILAISRVAALVMPLLGGWLGDRVGNRRIMTGSLWSAGLLTICTGFVPDFWLMTVVVAQAMLSVCFFPSGFAVLSSLEKKGGGSVVSLCVPVAFVIGGGILPVLIGAVGDRLNLGAGLMVVGLAMLIGGMLSTFVSFGK